MIEPEGKKPRAALTNENDGQHFCSDDELPAESFEDRLSWRNDHAFSDWTIVIVVNKQSPTLRCSNDDDNDDSSSSNSSNKEEVTYHVHKQNLAMGPRRSEYFVRLFENDGNFIESQENTSRIELAELAATAFPQLLDYMYTTGKKMAFTVDTATALYTLAKYFDVKRLQHEVKKFCIKDMRRWSSCGTYYEHATILCEDKIREPAMQSCRENIQYMKPTSRLLHVPDAQFWLDLLQKQTEQQEKPSSLPHIRLKTSRLVAAFCSNHAVSPQVFKQLTDEKYLPEKYIHIEAAVQFLDLERKILGSNNTKQDAATADDNAQLSSLQLRCVNIIVRCKQTANFKGESGDVLLNLSPLVLREIITRLVHGIPPTPPLPEEVLEERLPMQEGLRMLDFEI